MADEARHPDGRVLAKGDRYTCELCGGAFLAEQSDEEAWAEAELVFGQHHEDGGVARVCDGCWARVMRAEHRYKGDA